MENIRSLEEFIKEVKNNPELQNKLKEDPVGTLQELPRSEPVFTSDKLIYRIVVGGFVAVLLFGVIYFMYQYQRSIQVRTEYSQELLKVFKTISSKSLNYSDLAKTIKGPDGINGTAPDGIIAVFTAIIGALAGLFAPSPVSRNRDS